MKTGRRKGTKNKTEETAIVMVSLERKIKAVKRNRKAEKENIEIGKRNEDTRLGLETRLVTEKSTQADKKTVFEIKSGEKSI